MTRSSLLSLSVAIPLVFSFVAPAHADECAKYDECMAPVMNALSADLDCSAYEGMEPPEPSTSNAADPFSAIGQALGDAFYGIGVCFLDAINKLPDHLREQVYECTVIYPECDDISRYGELDLPPIKPTPEYRSADDILYMEQFGHDPNDFSDHDEDKPDRRMEPALPPLPSSELYQPSAEMAEYNRYRDSARATVTGLNGDLSYRETSEDEWKPLMPDTVLQGTYQIATGFESQVTLNLPGGQRIELQELAQFRVREFVGMSDKDLARAELLLKVGTLRAFVEREAAIPSDFRVSTPNATNAVRGTEFEVSTDGKDTTVRVFEGEVEVTSMFTGERAFVKPGEKISVVGNGPIQEIQTMSAQEIEEADWHSAAPETPSSLGFDTVGIVLIVVGGCSAVYLANGKKKGLKRK